jgi:hypothetical protein
MQRLTDLAESFRVYALCVPCGRMVGLDVDALVASHGRGLTVAEVRARVRCSICDCRTREIRIVYVGPRTRPVIPDRR